MIYATIDNDDLYIPCGAHIRAFATRADAEAWLTGGLTIDPEEFIAEISVGIFGDCWRKVRGNRPGPDDWHPMYASPFPLDQVQISAPGSHPGGNQYWITPKPEVLVLLLHPIAQETTQEPTQKEPTT